MIWFSCCSGNDCGVYVMVFCDVMSMRAEMSCLRHDMCGICGRNCYSAFCRGRLHTSHMHWTRHQLNISGGPCGGQYAVAWAKQLRLHCCVCVSFPYILPVLLCHWQSLWVWLHFDEVHVVALGFAVGPFICGRMLYELRCCVMEGEQCVLRWLCI